MLPSKFHILKKKQQLDILGHLNINLGKKYFHSSSNNQIMTKCFPLFAFTVYFKGVVESSNYHHNSQIQINIQSFSSYTPLKEYNYHPKLFTTTMRNIINQTTDTLIKKKKAQPTSKGIDEP